MRTDKIAFIQQCLLTIALLASPFTDAAKPVKVAVVSSYHQEYLWTTETHKGVIKALYKHKYFTSPNDAKEYTKHNYLKNQKIEIKKWWMDSKRKSSLPEIYKEVTRIIIDLQHFAPDIILTGDDSATNYIGNHYIDSDTPLIFWGINGDPMKYGFLDSLEQPNRNITGVYQADYLKESILFLKSLAPKIETITILADDSVSSRTRLKKLQRLYANEELPIDLVDIIITNKLEEWKERALLSAKTSDSFFIMDHNTLKDKDNKVVDGMSAGAWYLQHINKPEISYGQHFIEEGMLAAVSDSGIKQGFQATEIAIRVLRGENPGSIAVSPLPRGNYVVNRQRAKNLGIYQSISNNPNIEAWIDQSLALKSR